MWYRLFWIFNYYQFFCLLPDTSWGNFYEVNGRNLQFMMPGTQDLNLTRFLLGKIDLYFKINLVYIFLRSELKSKLTDLQSFSSAKF